MHGLTKYLSGPVLLLTATAAWGCAFPTYNLPIPFELYAFGAITALAVSFAIVCYAVSHTGYGGPLIPISSESTAGRRHLLIPAKVFSVFAFVAAFFLTLAIVAGFLGSPLAVANFNVTFFFVDFVLGIAYLVAILGDFYELINPWAAICRWIEARAPGSFAGRLAYPKYLSLYPALLFYMGYIWLELYGDVTPAELSVWLIAYTCINVCGAWMFGSSVWFKQAEFLGVFFRMIGKMAPLKYCESKSKPQSIEIIVRRPFVGLLDEPAQDLSALLFVLFMLSSTAVDGAHETLPWVNMFWKNVWPLIAAFIPDVQTQIALSVNTYYGWQWTMLLASPFTYLLVYVAFIYAAKIFAASSQPISKLILRFAYTLIPIAFVYNVTHYFVLLLGQGYQVVHMISDPFNRGWNLLGTAKWLADPFILDAKFIWHFQVAIILLGHIVSVYLAHVEAIKTFATTRRAIISQVPMLALMMAFTTLGLWILSLPIAAGQVADSSNTTVSLNSEIPAIPEARICTAPAR